MLGIIYLSHGLRLKATIPLRELDKTQVWDLVGLRSSNGEERPRDRGAEFYELSFTSDKRCIALLRVLSFDRFRLPRCSEQRRVKERR